MKEWYLRVNEVSKKGRFFQFTETSNAIALIDGARNHASGVYDASSFVDRKPVVSVCFCVCGSIVLPIAVLWVRVMNHSPCGNLVLLETSQLPQSCVLFGKKRILHL